MEPATMTNPGILYGGYKFPAYGTNVAKRGVETAMRTSLLADGLNNVLYQGRQIIQNGDFRRMGAIGKYILSGKTTGNKGYYNSLKFKNPEEDYYGGFDWIPENLRGKNDVIDAFLYGKEIDPEFGLYLQNKGNDFGIHTDYIAKYYPWKAKEIPVYGTSASDPLRDNIKVTGSKGVDSDIELDKIFSYNAAGHRRLFGTDAAGNQHTMEQDIWKFRP